MKIITGYARKNRKQPTPAEKWLKARLQRWGIYFRSQRPFGHYIVDFLLITRGLVVEVDGDYHLSPEQILKDIKRTAFLESQGLKVTRFSNADVFNNELYIKNQLLSYPEIYQRQGLRKTYPTSKADY